MKEATAFSPGHITGFFQICDQATDPLSKGSRGAGVSTKLGVTTKVQVEPSTKDSVDITINGQTVSSAIVSQHVLNAILLKVEGKHKIQINHQADVPIGAGFGTSGAGALSLAVALNEVFNLNLSLAQVGQIAHMAEIECKTGLGTVIGEAYGGFEIRSKAGAPGVGELQQIPLDKNYKVAALCFAPISKKDILTNQQKRERINMIGGEFVDELIKKPTLDNFIMLSRRFAEHVGLISTRLRNILDETDKEGITCSMAMFGENVYTIADPESIKQVTKIFQNHALNQQNLITSEIDFQGARLI